MYIFFKKKYSSCKLKVPNPFKYPPLSKKTKKMILLLFTMYTKLFVIFGAFLKAISQLIRQTLGFQCAIVHMLGFSDMIMFMIYKNYKQVEETRSEWSN